MHKLEVWIKYTPEGVYTQFQDEGGTIHITMPRAVAEKLSVYSVEK